MAKVRVFLSFEFDKDEPLHRNFYEQAKKCSCYAIRDYSMNEAYRPDESWLNKARKLICECDIVIVLVGQDTHNAPGVEKEVTIANQKGKPIFQIRPQGKTWGKVRGAGDLIPWKWSQVDEKIGELLN